MVLAALLACLAWPALQLARRLMDASAGTDSSALAEALPSAAGMHVLDAMGRHLELLVGTWALSIAVLSLRAGAGLAWIARTARHGGPDPHWQERLSRLALRFGVRRPVRLRVSDALASPVTAGWWRPVVLVPGALLTGMPPDLLEALLAHELAHVRRHDYLVNLLQNAVEILLFYHPAVWWLSSRIAERELIADDIAASKLGEPRRLALALSELERLQFSTQQLALAANGGDLMERIKRLLRPEAQGANWKAAIPALGLAVACFGGLANATAETKAVKADVRAVVDFNSCAKPKWPEASLKAEETGSVTLKFLIGEDGKVVDSTVDKSSGHPALDEAAREGIRQCAFKPGTSKGKPVRSWMKMRYVWELK
ncbi:M56 family metallopeptidase [Pseudoduganella namucuonensis]|uniref:M56 family metallopeptidase n=1 Tax=Pseudoduganella namucuonensis TaxID=1035707 RepID=UPI001E62FB85|nr:M56 family metallopeptidase [Pseudoduganella namucuonensis]